MKESVQDDTAIKFAAAFYKALASNKSISFSFDFAVNSIELNNLERSEIPILIN